MKIFISFVICLMICCDIYAQTAYFWSADVPEDPNINLLLTPKRYNMYEMDIVTGEIKLFLSFDETRFPDSNIPFAYYYISSFEFSRDKQKVYFIDINGELYEYDILADNLKLLLDISPDHNSILATLYTLSYDIFLLNDSTLYITGFTNGYYHINSGTFELVRQCTSINVSNDEIERISRAISVTTHRGKLLAFNAFWSINKYYPEDPEIDERLMQVFTPSGSDNTLNHGLFSSLVSIQKRCEQPELYLVRSRIHTTYSDVFFDRLDITTGTIIPSVISLDFTPFKDPGRRYRLFRTKVYNEKTWEECQRVVDLWGGNDTENNYEVGGLCALSGHRISDSVVWVNNDYPIDSLEIQIQQYTSGQDLQIPSGNYTILNKGNGSWILANNGTSSNADFASAINKIVYVNNGSYQGDVMIWIRAWYDGESGVYSRSTLRMANPLPDAGADVHMSQCAEAATIALSTYLSGTAMRDGHFYTSGGEEVKELWMGDPGEYEYTYVVESQGCTDTSSMRIEVLPSPSPLNYAPVRLCAEEEFTILISGDFAAMRWQDTGSDHPERTLRESGVYYVDLISEEGCVSTDSIVLWYYPAAISTYSKVRMCEGEVYLWDGVALSEPGVYTIILLNESGCDSLYQELTLEYIAAGNLEIPELVEICEGDELSIALPSGFIDVRVDGEPVWDNLHLSGGAYEISALDSNGCTVSQRIEILERAVPRVYTEDVLDLRYESGIALPVSYLGNIVEYEWLPRGGHLDCFDCPYPRLVAPYEGILQVMVEDEIGCRATSSVRISLATEELYLANTISNHPINRSNGVFGLRSNSEVIYDMEVYDRWGNKVYGGRSLSSKNESEGWEPNGQYSPGVYIYVIQLNTATGKRLIKGDVTLL